MRSTVSRDIQQFREVETRRPPVTELREAVERVLNTGTHSLRIVDFESQPLKYASSFAIEEIGMQLNDGRRMALICKDTSLAAMLPEARRIKPAFLRHPSREIATYASILEPSQVGAPTFFGAVIDPSRDRYWLLLERVNGSPLAEVGDFDVWLEAGAWLARLHSDVEVTHVPSFEDVPLLRYTPAFYKRWMRRARRFILESSAESRARRQRVRWLASRYDTIVDEVAALPSTFVHGEFYASNIVVEDGPRGAVIRPVDWELSGIGYPLMDLAALIAGWDEPARRELAFSYYAALDPQAPTFVPPETFIRALDCSRVLLAVQCLGWSGRWVPPEQHSRDWLHEAVVAADRIGL